MKTLKFFIKIISYSLVVLFGFVLILGVYSLVDAKSDFTGVCYSEHFYTFSSYSCSFLEHFWNTFVGWSTIITMLGIVPISIWTITVAIMTLTHYLKNRNIK